MKFTNNNNVIIISILNKDNDGDRENDNDNDVESIMEPTQFGMLECPTDILVHLLH